MTVVSLGSLEVRSDRLTMAVGEGRRPSCLGFTLSAKGEFEGRTPVQFNIVSQERLSGRLNYVTCNDGDGPVLIRLARELVPDSCRRFAWRCLLGVVSDGTLRLIEDRSKLTAEQASPT